MSKSFAGGISDWKIQVGLGNPSRIGKSKSGWKIQLGLENPRCKPGAKAVRTYGAINPAGLHLKSLIAVEAHTSVLSSLYPGRLLSLLTDRPVSHKAA